MSTDPAQPQCPPCPKVPDSRDASPLPEIYGPQENYASLQMSSAETTHTETISPLPASMDLLQDSLDSATSPRVKVLPTSAEEITVKKEDPTLGKKQIRPVFSQTQLCVLSDRSQGRKYLSLQQMQELSNVLNLSYKQVKTWFQNQRMKCKRWQKNNWPKNYNSETQKGSATPEYPGFYSYHQGCLMNTARNPPIWGNQSCNSQTYCPQARNSQLHNCGEDFLQPQVQFQQNSISNLQSTLEMAGESHRVLQQTTKYFSAQQIMDFFPNYSEHIA